MFLGQIQGLFMTMRLWDILDILVVAFFLYRIYILIRDTRATALLKGLVFLGIFTVIAGWLQLHVVSWILDKLMTVLIVALPVVFQPELRRALEQIGRGKFYVSSRVMNEVEWDHVIDDVVAATMTMSANKIGALIVFERSVGLDDRIDTGIRIEGLVSKELLGNACCLLPVTIICPRSLAPGTVRLSACPSRQTASSWWSVRKRASSPTLMAVIFTAARMRKV